MSEDWIREELRGALDDVYRPASGLLDRSMDTVRRHREGRPWSWVAALAAFLLALAAIGVLLSARMVAGPAVHRAAPRITASLPAPDPQPVTRTDPGAQVAWLTDWTEGGRLIGIDPSGRTVGHIETVAPGDGLAATYGVWRSADGATIFTVAADHLTAYSARDGSLRRTYPRAAGQVEGDAFSPDGHWLALLLLNGRLQLDVIDLRGGGSQMLPLPHDPNAKLPGFTGPANSAEWGMPVFSSDSAHLVTLTDWGGPVRLTTFKADAGTFAQVTTAVNGRDGRHFPNCLGPAMAAKVVKGGRTFVAFCHYDGSVWFFDLASLRLTDVVRPQQPNPFFLSPIFTPDGHLLYLSLRTSMQVVDLTTGRLRGPAGVPTGDQQRGPFAWIVTTAYAGGVASTVPISPDGRTLYAATNNGVVALRVPDLQPLRVMAPQLAANEVWVSGDGHTIYATALDGRHLTVMRDDGSQLRTIDLSGSPLFVASEHG